MQWAQAVGAGSGPRHWTLSDTVFVSVGDMLVVSARQPWQHGHLNSDVCVFIYVVIALWPCGQCSYIYSTFKSQRIEIWVLSTARLSCPATSFKIRCSSRYWILVIRLFLQFIIIFHFPDSLLKQKMLPATFKLCAGISYRHMRNMTGEWENQLPASLPAF